MEEKDLKARKEEEGERKRKRKDRLGRGLQSPRASFQMTQAVTQRKGREEGPEREGERTRG